MTQARSGRDGLLRVAIPGFGGGCGKTGFVPGYYTLGLDVDTRYGLAMPGPREVADLTGIAAGYRVVKMLKHADTDIVVATNGTNTRVYRKETTWVSKVDQVDGGASSENITGVATDAISFKSVLAIALGASTAYLFTTATTATGRTWDFTSSTKSGSNSKYANYFLVQVNGLLAPRVTYVRNPNEVYYTEDLTNGDATGSTPSYIGDNATAEQYFTSITQDVTGKVLLGMRHALYSLDSDGVVTKLTPDYPDPALDAGLQGDRLNFETPVHIQDRIYFPVRGYDILEYHYGRLNDRIAPRHLGPELPLMFDLPINAMTTVGGWLLIATGSNSVATLRSASYVPGGSVRIGNGPTAISHLWAGRWQQQPDGSEAFAWHGVLLRCTNILRYMWWDEDDNYLYLASADAEASADIQMTRCLFPVDNPLTRLVSSSIVLTTGIWYLEMDGFDFGKPWDYKELLHGSIRTMGLNATSPTEIFFQYKVTSDDITDSFESTERFNTNALAQIGLDFPTGLRFLRCDIRVQAVPAGGDYIVLREAEIQAQVLPREREARATR